MADDRTTRGCRVTLAALVLTILVAAAGGSSAADDGRGVGGVSRDPPAGSRRPPVIAWTSDEGRNHPLVGTMWTDGQPGPVELGALKGMWRGTGVALLGEVHDNADHHVVQAAALQLLSSGASTAVVFEHLRTDQQPAIDAFMARPTDERTLVAFYAAVDWAKSGWSKYAYGPLFEAVLKAGLPIYAGDPPRDVVRTAAKDGPSALPQETRAELAIDRPLEPRLQDASLTEIEAAHCGMMPKAAFGGMAFAQRLRDASLADVALKALATHGSVIVFAGNGHVRRDRGVPWYIRERAPATTILTLALAEVADGRTDPATYVPRDPDGRPAVDGMIFTPRASRGDPCDAFRSSKGGPKP